MERKYEVYKITNKINGKLYVGITSQGYKKRWYKHCSDSIRDSYFPIHQAIRKHGVDNFSVEVLEACETVEILKERETYWIKELKSRTTEGGYNLTEGGDGTFGRLHSEETKEKIRQKALGRKLSKEICLNRSLKSKMTKTISQFTLDGEYIKTYRSVSTAAKELGIFATNIAACARGKYKESGGFKWSYTDRLPEDPIEVIPEKPKVKIKRNKLSEDVKRRIKETNKLRWAENPERRKKASLNNPKNHPILQYTLDGVFVKEYRSVAQAVEAVGASTHTNIAKCARGVRKSACGFTWKYKDNNKPIKIEENESSITTVS